MGKDTEETEKIRLMKIGQMGHIRRIIDQRNDYE